MTESVATPKRKHSIWYGENRDTSPVSRLRFTENEWKLILAAITMTADALVKEYHEHRPFWSGEGGYFMAHEQDPNSEKGKLWRFHTDRCFEIKRQVARLNRIERQLQIHLGMIDGSFPEYMRTRERIMN